MSFWDHPPKKGVCLAKPMQHEMSDERKLLMSWIQMTIADSCSTEEQFKVKMVLANPSPEIDRLLDNAEAAIEIGLSDVTAEVLNGVIYAEGLD